MNRPYVKQYNELGQVINPITKNNPYLTIAPNRAQRRSQFSGRPFSNKKGIGLVITKSPLFDEEGNLTGIVYDKWKRRRQTIGNKTIVHTEYCPRK